MAAAAKGGSGGDIRIDQHLSLLSDARMPELDLPSVEAYAVVDSRNSNRKLFARVPERDCLPRLDIVGQLGVITEAPILRLAASGQVAWPGKAWRPYALVFDQPASPPLMPSLIKQQPPLPVEDIKRKLIAPLLLALAHLGRRGITHRAIRPDNVYYASEARNSVILGDCVSVPPSWRQSALFEPIDAGEAPAFARGAGTQADDLYALGVTILCLALGYCPLIQLPDHEIVTVKSEQTSYAALLAGNRPPPGLREVLRGLLADEIGERWTIQTLERWLSGELDPPPTTLRELKVDRPFDFAGGKFRQTRDIARAFGRAWKEAITPLRSRALEMWLKRCDAESGLLEEITVTGNILNVEAKRTEAEDARIVFNVCGQLDPRGPIRYRGLAARPDGLGGALAAAYFSGDKAASDLVGEMILNAIPTDWYRTRGEPYRGDDETMIRQFRRLQQFMRTPDIGFGTVRCLYELNPNLPSQFEPIAALSLESLKGFLAALDAVVAAEGKLPTLLDTHLVSFIAARRSRSSDRELTGLQGSQKNPLDAKLCVLRLLMAVQEEFGPSSVPALTKWIAEEIASAANRISGKTLRERVRRRLDDAVSAGRLDLLHAALCDEALLREDAEGSARAAREYAAAQGKIDHLGSQKHEAFARRMGWSVAAALSSFIAVTTVSVLVIW
ncbi:MAG: hypothetical protein AB7K86_02565 [Rhodospirillales bacterium]